MLFIKLPNDPFICGVCSFYNLLVVVFFNDVNGLITRANNINTDYLCIRVGGGVCSQHWGLLLPLMFGINCT